MTEAVDLTVWTDPSCPWAWQASRWLRELRSRGILRLEWRLFSLEVNAAREHDATAPVRFREASMLHGDALLALRAALDEGQEPFEDLYGAIGGRLHDGRRNDSRALVEKAAAEVGLEDLARDAFTREGELGERIVQEHADAREQSVFGVPSLRLAGSKVAYGPLVAVAPTGEEALELWTHTRYLLERDDFFELKRWPRDIRPGGRPA
jgi:predicted DsbA family dithiol-disulfide isomerase